MQVGTAEVSEEATLKGTVLEEGACDTEAHPKHSQDPLPTAPNGIT